jgi:hypothetical protein
MDVKSLNTRKRAMRDSEEDILASSSDEGDDLTDEQSESVRWMMGARQKQEELEKLKAKLASMDGLIITAERENAQLKEMLAALPDIGPPSSPPTTTTTTDDRPTGRASSGKKRGKPDGKKRIAQAPTSADGRTRVYLESIGLVTKRLAELAEHEHSGDLQAVWRAYRVALSDIVPAGSPDPNRTRDPEMAAAVLRERLIAALPEHRTRNLAQQ